MSAAIEDLWPPIGIPEAPTPLAILRQQASLLGPKTQHLVEAHVATKTVEHNFVHTFSIVAPTLDQYRYTLFQVLHGGTTLYPAYFGTGEPSLQEAIRNETDGLEVASLWFGGCAQMQEAVEASDEGQLLSVLRAILSSEHTRQVASALLAQSRDGAG